MEKMICEDCGGIHFGFKEMEPVPTLEEQIKSIKETTCTCRIYLYEDDD